MTTFNLALLPADEKQAIELDKQAAYDVWKVRSGQEPEFYLEQQKAKMSDPEQLSRYQQAVDLYKTLI
ncbi:MULTISPECIES: DUF3283 family protein [unclassified Motilimonas]|uniref:DUF3283 family protein n=1 Tax=unclassified Motilimonas TaxID=2643697 RepID=UPI001E33E4BD|nr:MULTISPECIES: DUF3283 family protein [unclassified Motilimonas]MCE0556958.1 DUF3283 family protein [Motilimonas sp. E26]MDO6525491.1 DUF3283 family protein [Motilimonas sp. 1_MG-2023]